MMWFITLIRLEIVSFFSCFSSSLYWNNILEGIIADFRFPHFFSSVFFICFFFCSVSWNHKWDEKLRNCLWICGTVESGLKTSKASLKFKRCVVFHILQQSYTQIKYSWKMWKKRIKQNRQFSCEVQKSQEKLREEVEKMYKTFCRWINRNVKFSFTQCLCFIFI